MIICTSICANYLPKAMTLAASVKKYIPDAFFVLCLLEKEYPEKLETFPHFDAIVLAKDLGWENFEPFIFRHTIVEAATAVKGQLLLHLFEKYQSENKLVYLDPDVRVYADFTELRELLDEHSLILAPHLLRPGNIDMEISSLAHGCYNLGFIALQRSNNAQAFMQWWAARLFSYCYDDKARGLFTDQRWVDLAPCFFDVFVLKHHGYDFATWSLLNCQLEEVDGNILVNGDSLRFIHFSGLDGGTIDWAMEQWLQDPVGKDIFARLYKEYQAEHKENDTLGFSKILWSYASYNDGATISKKARYIFREEEESAQTMDPFETGETAILSLKKGALKRKVLELAKKVPAHLQRHGIAATLGKILKKAKLGLGNFHH